MGTMTEPTLERHTEDTRRTWLQLLLWTAAVVAAVDVVFMLLAGAAIPPFVISTVLTVVGVALLRRWPRAGVIVLLATALLMLIGGGPGALTHLDQPSSGIDWSHAVVGVFGRLVVVVAAIGALRRAGAATARRLATASAGLFALTLLVAAVATAASDAIEPDADDVVTVVLEHDFEAAVVSAGGTLFVDNQEMFRHTYTVPGTDIDLDLPANGAARTVVDLAPGTYDVRCEIPGHDAMQGTLEVR